MKHNELYKRKECHSQREGTLFALFVIIMSYIDTMYGIVLHKKEL